VPAKCAIEPSILVRTNTKNRSSEMTFLLSTTDKQLQMLRDRQDKLGADARKEIQRRKMVGYCDGTAIEKIDAKAPIIEPESTVGTSPDRVYATGVRRV